VISALAGSYDDLISGWGRVFRAKEMYAVMTAAVCVMLAAWLVRKHEGCIAIEMGTEV